jgi:hypothetical protein
MGQIILGGPIEQRGGVVYWRVDVAVMLVRVAAAGRDPGFSLEIGMRGRAAFSLGHCFEILAGSGI